MFVFVAARCMYAVERGDIQSATEYLHHYFDLLDVPLGGMFNGGKCVLFYCVCPFIMYVVCLLCDIQSATESLHQ